jgi:hypothetical protein
MSLRFVPAGLLAAAVSVVPVLSPVPLAGQTPDTAYGRLIREYTSDPRFLPAGVATLPDHPTVPSPRDHFGTIVGAPGVMHTSAEVYGYLRALAAATPRVTVETVGRTEEGRDIVLVVIADDASMGRLESYRAATARLADPRTLPAAELERVLDQAKPIYYLNGGLHSPEMGSPEMLMELAYRLAVSDDPAIVAIRQGVITLINPVSEPDGRDRQVDWYRRYTRHRTDWEDGFPRSSPYWGKYVYHDNNRDGLQLSQELTKAVNREYFRWHPTVMHDLHESVPLLYVSTGTGPYNETIDPVTVAEWQLMAQHDVTALTVSGQPGVWSWGFYDGWWPGYLIWLANNRNGIGRFYETFGNAGANTYVRDLSSQRYAGDSVTSRLWYRPAPPTRRVRWSARDNTNYMQAGVLASLDYVATNGRSLLRNFWLKGLNNVRRGRTEKPYAFTIAGPERQRDPRRVAYLVNQLRRQGIEVHRRAGGAGAGDFVIRLDQPYRNFAVSLLTKQNFPSNAPHPPYDDVAWTLGLLYGVDVKEVNDSGVFTWSGLAPVTDTVAFTPTVRGAGPVYALAYRAQSEVLPALYWLRTRAPGARVSGTESGVVAGGDTLPAGSVIFESVDRAAAGELAARFGLPLVSLARAPAAPAHPLDLPRVAIYHTWTYTQDEGWARFTFDQLGIPYTSIHKDDLRQGGLRTRFDVIVVPSTGGASVTALIHGVDAKWSPLPYTTTADHPSHGTPSATADMTGGPGFAGLSELQRFVQQGGVLVTLRNATRLAAETGIARELSPLGTGALFHPGSVVRAKARRPGHPLLYGYPETTHVFRGNGPLYEVDRRDRGMVVLQYGTELPADERAAARRDGEGGLGLPQPAASGADSARGGSGGSRPGQYVLSGMVRSQDQIVGQGALFDVPVGEAGGRVIAFTFNPLHRFLNHHEFGMLWNGLLHWNDLPPNPAAPVASRRADSR